MDQRRSLRTFYIILLTQTFSMIGSRISGLAVGFEVFAQTGQATTLTLVAFFAILPGLLATGFAGVLSDRWDRRKIIILSDFGQAVATLFLLFSFLSGSFQLWHLYAVTIAQSLFDAFQWPAFSASVTMMVPDSERDRANTLQQLTGPLAGIIAPAIAGVVFALVGVTGAILVDLITFLTAVSVLLIVRIPQPARDTAPDVPRPSIWQDMADSFRYLWERKPLLTITLLIALVACVLNGILTLLLPYLLLRLGGSGDTEALTGGLLALMNVGALVGGIVMVAWGRVRQRMRVVTVALLFTAVMVIGLGTAHTLPALAVVLFIMMLPVPTGNALLISILQGKVAPHVQGRVFAVIDQLAQVLTPLAYLLVGPLADQVFEPAVEGEGWALVAPLVGDTPGAGMGLMFVLAGALVFGLMLAIYAVPSVRHIETLLPDYVPMPDEIAPEAGALAPRR